MLLQFIGLPHVRDISQKDFASLGLDHGNLHVDRREETVVEVPDDVADWLIKNDKDGPDAMWKEAPKKEADRYKAKEELLAKLSTPAEAESGADSAAETAAEKEVPLKSGSSTPTANTRSRST